VNPDGRHLDPHAFFWPVFTVGDRGIAVVLDAWDVYWRKEIAEEDIRHEMDARTGGPERAGG
jgi:hypothetical protein